MRDFAGSACGFFGSSARAVKVVALDAPSESLAKQLSRNRWQRAMFFTARNFGSAPRGDGGFSMPAWLSDLAGRTKYLIDEVATADLVVMIASAGTGGEAAAVIAEACAVRKVMTTALIIGSAEKSDDELSKTLAFYDPSKVDAGQRANTIAIVGMAGGTVLVAAGAALYWWGYTQSRLTERISLAPIVSNQLAGLVVAGTWR